MPLVNHETIFTPGPVLFVWGVSLYVDGQQGGTCSTIVNHNPNLNIASLLWTASWVGICIGIIAPIASVFESRKKWSLPSLIRVFPFFAGQIGSHITYLPFFYILCFYSVLTILTYNTNPLPWSEQWTPNISAILLFFFGFCFVYFTSN